MKLYTLLLSVAVLSSLASCEKEYDSPPLAEIPEGSLLTIGDIRTWQQSAGTISIQEDYSVYGVITMDEADGNIYKNIYMQDVTGAVNIRLMSGGGIYKGDSVRIYLNGCYLSEFNGVLQIDSVDVDNNVIKQETNVNFAPEITTIDQITVGKESELIQLNNVQFIAPDLDKTYADAVGQQSVNLTLEDANGNTILVRTSGYASFASELVAQWSGSLIAIVGEYNGELQLLIRSYSEIDMTANRFAGLVLVKNFDDENLLNGGWSVQQIVGQDTWVTSDQSSPNNTHYGMISNFDAVNSDCESWLISPSMDLTTSTAPYATFNNAYNYGGDPLQLLVSTDYNGTGDPNGFTWATLPVSWSSGGWDWVSANVDLTAYISATTYIAFKYTGDTVSGSTWEIDDIVVHG